MKLVGKIIRNKVAANAGWIIVSKIIQAVFGFVVAMLSARYLGPSNYGLINYAGSVVAFVAPVATLGFSAIIVQELIRHKDEEELVMGTVTGFALLSSIVCILGVLCFVVVANRGEKETQTVCVVYSLMIFFQVSEMISYWFQAHLLSRYSSIVSLFSYMVMLGYKLFLLVKGKNVIWFALSNSIDYFLIAMIGYLLYRKLGGKKYSFSFKLGRQFLKTSKYYILSYLMITVFSQTDKIMIKHMIDEANVGFYSAALTGATATSFVFSALIDSFRPVILSYRENDIRQYELNLIRLYSLVIYMSFFQSVIMCVFAEQFVVLLYGNAFLQSVGAMRVVVWYATFSYVGSVRNIWILSENKQKYMWMIDVSGAAVNVVLNLILIPVYGIIGAAFASFATQCFANFILGWILKPIRYNNRLMIKSLNPKYVLDMLRG